MTTPTQETEAIEENPIQDELQEELNLKEEGKYRPDLRTGPNKSQPSKRRDTVLRYRYREGDFRQHWQKNDGDLITDGVLMVMYNDFISRCWERVQLGESNDFEYDHRVQKHFEWSHEYYERVNTTKVPRGERASCDVIGEKVIFYDKKIFGVMPRNGGGNYKRGATSIWLW